MKLANLSTNILLFVAGFLILDGRDRRTTRQNVHHLTRTRRRLS